MIILASYLILIPMLVSGIFALRLPRAQWMRFILIVLIAALLALGLAQIASLIYFSPRPFVRLHTSPLIPHGIDNGFPSDHMLLAAFVASVVFIKNKKLGLVLWIVAMLIGLGRVLALVHSPIDIWPLA